MCSSFCSNKLIHQTNKIVLLNIYSHIITNDDEMEILLNRHITTNKKNNQINSENLIYIKRLRFFFFLILVFIEIKQTIYQFALGSIN